MKYPFLVLLAVLIPACASAQTADQTDLISIAATDVPIRTVLDQIAQQSGATILLAPDVSGSISATLSNVSLQTALDRVTRAAYLQWRETLAPSNVTSDQMAQAVKAVDSAPASSVIVAGQGDKPTSALLSGAVADRVWAMGSTLGLKEVYWVYAPTQAVKQPPAAATTDTATAATDSSAKADNQDTPDSVYKAMTKSLSALPPDQALAVVQQIGNEVLAAMSPEERMALLGYGAQAPAPPPGPLANMFRARVNMVRPGVPSLIVSPGYGSPGGYFW